MEDTTYYVGTNLSSHGLYENYTQYNAAKKRELLPQNMYILSWMNFSSISMCLLSAQASCEDLSEIIVGDNSIPLSRFLGNQLLKLWKSMRRNFSLLYEELEYLIIEVMHRWMQVSNS